MAQDGRKGKFGRKNCIVPPGRKGGGKEKKMGRRGEKEEKRTSYKVSIELSKSHGRWEKNLSLPLPVAWNGINEDTAII